MFTLTPEFLQALTAWTQNGQRNVTIKFGYNQPRGPEVWMYDVNLQAGKYFNPGDSLDFDKELKEQAIQAAKDRVRELEAMV